MAQIRLYVRKASWRWKFKKFIELAVKQVFYSAFYFSLIILLRFLVNGFDLKSDGLASWLVYYPAFIAPIISLILNFMYTELASPWLRFVFWVHMMFNLIWTPVVFLL